MAALLLIVIVAIVASQPGGGPLQPARKTFSRPEFQMNVQGRFPEAVVEFAGKPDRTKDNGRTITMYYFRRTTDPTNGAIDRQAVVEFAPAGGPVARILFE